MLNLVIPDSVKLPKKKRDHRYSFDKHQKFNYFTIPGYDNLIKFAIIPNRKDPARPNHLDLEKADMLNMSNNYNVGILSGHKAGFVIIDIDLYKMIKDVSDDFILKFKEELETFFGTFVVRTSRGGLHLYFNYDVEIRQYQENPHNQNPKHVDIRNDRGYVLCPPSCINGSFYETVNNKEIIDIPPKLKQWLLDNLYTNKAEKKISKKSKTKFDKNNNIDDTYNITCNNLDALQFLDNLIVDCKKKEKDNRGSYSNWMHIMRGFKYAGGKIEDFNEWSKKTIHGNYDENQLFALWRCVKPEFINYLYFLKYAGVRNRYSYKKIPDDNFTNYNIYPDKVRLQIDGSGINFFKPNINYLTKGPPNVGKSFSFRKHACYQDDPFISITSRKTLSYEQFRDFKKEIRKNNLDIEIHHYEDKDYYPGDNIIITPESSCKLISYNFSNYIIFMDEYDSIINHTLTSETLDKNRFLVWKTLIKMILTCKQFICVDGDISQTSKYLLDYFKLDYQFDIFTKSSYEGVEVEILYDETQFYDILRSTDVYLFCSDTKKEVKILKKYKVKIGHEDLFCITSDTDMRKVKMDHHKKTAISPKVIYGLNSLMQRIVFCNYTGKTISPSQMVQQICRCRDIKKVYIFFPDIFTKTEKYETTQDVDKNYEYLLNNYNSKMVQIGSISFDCEDDSTAIKYRDQTICDQELIELYNKLYKMNEYRQDCYNTNKFLHLLDILKKRGFVIKNNFTGTIIRDKDKKKEMDQELKNMDIAEFTEDSERVTRINEYLKIPQNKINDYKELFIDKHLLSQHFNISSFFYTEEVDNLKKLLQRQDFDIGKCKDIKLKLILLNSMLNKIELDKKNIGLFEPKNKTFKDDESVKKLLTDYQKLIRLRKDVSFDNDLLIYKEICNMYKQLFGITKASQSRFKGLKTIYENEKEKKEREEKEKEEKEEKEDKKNKKSKKDDENMELRVQIHEFVPDVLEFHRTLCNYRKIKNNKGKEKVIKKKILHIK